MPWTPGGDDDNKGPWGNSGGQWGGKKPSSSSPIEDLIQKIQGRFNSFMPKGSGNNSYFFVILTVIAGIWLSTGFYRVNEGEQAVVLRFGKWVETTQPGLRYHLPYPIERIFKRQVSIVNRIDSGVDSAVGDKLTYQGLRFQEDQPLMLTGDENILEGRFTVLWFIKDLGQYLFKARNPDETVKVAAESIVREIIAQTSLDDAIAKKRGEINLQAQQELQKLVDEYELGVQIQEVRLQKVDPPAAVISDFRAVQGALAKKEQLINEARSYENSIIPVAEGEALSIYQQAEAYKFEQIAQAEGEAQRFIAVLKAYEKAPDVMKKRLYIETVQKTLKGKPKVFFSGKSTQGTLPHLALPAISGLKAGPVEKSAKVKKSEEAQQ